MGWLGGSRGLVDARGLGDGGLRVFGGGWLGGGDWCDVDACVGPRLGVIVDEAAPEMVADVDHADWRPRSAFPDCARDASGFAAETKMKVRW